MRVNNLAYFLDILEMVFSKLNKKAIFINKIIYWFRKMLGKRKVRSRRYDIILRPLEHECSDFINR